MDSTLWIRRCAKSTALDISLHFAPRGICDDLCDLSLYAVMKDVRGIDEGVTLSLRLSCQNTATRHTDIVRFDALRSCHEFEVGDIALADAQLKTLRLRCCVRVLLCSCLQLGDMARFRYEWCVANELYYAWLRCEVGCKFESDVFDGLRTSKRVLSPQIITNISTLHHSNLSVE